MSRSERLTVERVSAAWGGAPVLHDVSLGVGDAEFVSLLGPNGSGKTTLLRIIAGLETPNSGEVYLNGRCVTHVPTHRRGIGMLAQDPALFPRRTVFENIAYGLRLRREPEAEVRRKVGELAELLHLEGVLLRHPEQLSGGQRQRVSIARSMAPGPTLLLLDEPFENLDPEIRAELRAEVKPILRERGIACLHVTHDLEEGLFLGDRVALLREGHLLQVGPPNEVFRAPASEGAARLLGYNIIGEGEARVAVHPTDLEIVPAGESTVRGAVIGVGPSGPGWVGHVRLVSGTSAELRGVGPPPAVVAGEAVGLRFARRVAISPNSD